MESLITKKTIDEQHEEALLENLTEEDKIYDTPVEPRVLRIELPVDVLLTSNRQQKRKLYAGLVKNINAKIEMIRQELRIKE